MNGKNKSKIKGDNNVTTQIETQNIFVESPRITNSKYSPDEKACMLLKETIEDEKNNMIIYVKTLSGRTIQCGNGKFTVNSKAVGEKEMAFWEDSLQKLIRHRYIGDVDAKGEVFKILKLGYDYYDNFIKKVEHSLNMELILNDDHIKILQILRDNGYTLWDSQLERIFRNSIDLEIAFNELLEYDYIIDGMTISSDYGSSYCVNSSKKIEILKILKNIDKQT